MIGLTSPTHVLLVLVVLLLVFGAKRLPELGRSVGSGMREFKTSLTDAPTEPRASLAVVPEAAPVAPVGAVVELPAARSPAETAPTPPAA